MYVFSHFDSTRLPEKYVSAQLLDLDPTEAVPKLILLFLLFLLSVNAYI